MFSYCSSREDLSIDVTITNVGLILTKLRMILRQECRTKECRTKTRMSPETHRLNLRGNMDTPMRERRICD